MVTSGEVETSVTGAARMQHTWTQVVYVCATYYLWLPVAYVSLQALQEVHSGKWSCPSIRQQLLAARLQLLISSKLTSCLPAATALIVASLLL